MSQTRFIMNSELRKFHELIHKDANSLELAVIDTKDALKAIADDFRFGRVIMVTTAPSTRIRPEGMNENTLLYEYDGHICEEKYEINFSLPDGGNCKAIIYPRGDKPFEENEILNLKYLFTEVFMKFSRCSTLGLLQRVLFKDLDTDAATLTGFMKFAGEQIQKGNIQNYYVLFFNIHNFKYVNKVFPYIEGDVVLKKYTHLLLDELDHDEVLARLGGDNYVGLIKADRILSYLDFIREVRLTHEAMGKKKSFIFGATVGYSALDGIQTPRDIMSRASISFQAARKLGGGSAVEYSDSLRQELMAYQEILSKFQFALLNHEFVVYYQPKVDLNTKTICGAEALARWIQNGNVVPPNDFIPVLEQDGSICTLDFYVLEQVCAFLRKRIDQGLEPVCISVNFSRRHLEDDYFIDKTLEIIDRYQLDHKYIEVELTESNDYQNYQKIRTIVNKFKENNVSTSMDDFGTGFSSLNMIKEVDLNVIKIDKSLIPEDNKNSDREKDQILFESLVQLIHQLGKKAIAEGVETPKQLEYITNAGCRIVQGYIFDKPLSEENFVKRLHTGYLQ